MIILKSDFYVEIIKMSHSVYVYYIVIYYLSQIVQLQYISLFNLYEAVHFILLWIIDLVDLQVR